MGRVILILLGLLLIVIILQNTSGSYDELGALSGAGLFGYRIGVRQVG